MPLGVVSKIIATKRYTNNDSKTTNGIVSFSILFLYREFIHITLWNWLLTDFPDNF